jgi:eukaryotic-like serine/threonine-protein kinase
MSLAAGSKLGPYKILAPIGEGGMGEVYRARDTKLDRDVAIKVLPAALAQDAEGLARFEREVKVLAALNHPNIAQIYGVEESGGVGALLMELVPGESLKGPLPLETALNYAKQIADALEAAHAKGIVHRDLKPANIMGHDGGRGEGARLRTGGKANRLSRRSVESRQFPDAHYLANPRRHDLGHRGLHEPRTGSRQARG